MPNEEQPDVAIPGSADRDDLRVLLRRVLRTDEAAPVRLTRNGDDRLRVWLRTPFGALASRVVHGRLREDDLIVGADDFLTSLDVLSPIDSEGHVDVGMQMRSAWSGILPPSEGFTVIEVVPAQVLLDLAETGRNAARENAGPLGLPPSLLDSTALIVGSDTENPVEIETRTVFALDSVGFVPTRAGRAPEDEPVRVSALGPWVRLDARFGTIHRRPEQISLGVL